VISNLSKDLSSPPTFRQGSAVNNFAAGLAILLTVLAIAWAADFFRWIGLLLYTEQFLSGILAVAVPLVFITIRLDRSRSLENIPVFDWLLAIAGFISISYVSLRYPALAELVATRPVDGLITGFVMMILIVEGLRRTVGLALTIVVMAFVVVALLGHHIPGTLAGRKIESASLIYYLAWDPTGILGAPMNIVATIVTAFVFFGQVLSKSGGSKFFTDVSMILVGRYRGGQAKIAVTASGFFGSISGSVVSNVVTTGVITIPLMKRAGYKSVQAGAIEAVASTGGQLMPPIMGAAAFLMAEFLEIPYTEVVLAALIPAVLYYLALFILADLEAGRTGIQPMDADEIPDLFPVLKGGWHFPLPFVVLILALFYWNLSPELSALASAFTILITSAIFGYNGQRFTIVRLIQAVHDTGLAVLDIIMIGAAAGIIIGSLNVTGIGFGLSLALVEIGNSNLFTLLLVSAGICILLGMGMPTVAVYMLLATLVAPALVEVGIEPLAAHLFILYFGMMSMITPPVAIAAFTAASLSGADAMRTGFSAMRFGWFAYIVPFLFVFSPPLLMQGKPIEIIWAAVSAAIGVWLVSIATMGFFRRNLNSLNRLLFGLAGTALLIPVTSFSGAYFTDIGGLILGMLLVCREILAERSIKIINA
jgi:TRAP transporter 4TM/12TM fusion protein